jgi:hypothetical protein
VKAVALAVTLVALVPAAAEAKSFTVSLSGTARKDVAMVREYSNPSSLYCQGQATSITSGFVFAKIAGRPGRQGFPFTGGNFDFVAKLSGQKAETTREVTGGFTPKPDAPPGARPDECTIPNQQRTTTPCRQFSQDAVARTGSPFRMSSVRGNLAVRFFPSGPEFAIGCQADSLGGIWMIGAVPTKLTKSAVNRLAVGKTATKTGRTVQNSGPSGVQVVTTLVYTLKVKRTK